MRFPLPAVLSGLLLAACGGASETGLAPAGEPLGTQASALCSGLSVTSLTIEDVTSYQGEAAGSGGWAVSTFSSGVRLDYYVDGVLRSTDERTGTSGTWYFSASGMTCGVHTFMVKATPMVIDSANNRTTCWDGTTSNSKNFRECPVPPPTASFSCERVSSTGINCTGSVSSGGTGPYTPLWQDYHAPASYPAFETDWYASEWSQYYTCAQPTSSTVELLQVRFKVQDADGQESSVMASQTFSCRPNSVLYRY